MRTARAILHVDMDAFFAAVEVLDDPSLKDKPVIVGGESRKRGVVAAASYEARRFGVHSAMPTAEAFRRCPHAILKPARHDRYAEMSDKVMAILGSVTPLLEQVSVDEAYLDVTGSEALFGDPPAIARRIKDRIRKDLCLTCSVGVAKGKVFAKIASDLEKPDGLTVVPEDGPAFMAPLPVGKIPGVGPKLRETLALLGIRTIGDLARHPIGPLERRIGSWAAELRALANGEDDRPVVTDRDAKGMSRESTFAEFLDDPRDVDDALLALADDVAERLRSHGLTARTITLKVRDEKFSTRTRSRALDQPTDLGDVLHANAADLLKTVDLKGLKIRLLGVGSSGFDPAGTGQMALLRDARADKTRTLAGTVDRIRKKHGDAAVVRAQLLKGRKVTKGGWEAAE